MQQILLEYALPLARANLAENGIDGADHWLDIIETRVRTRATGAAWIAKHWKKFGNGAQLVCDYIAQAKTNQPVHSWQEPGA